MRNYTFSEVSCFHGITGFLNVKVSYSFHEITTVRNFQTCERFVFSNAHECMKISDGNNGFHMKYESSKARVQVCSNGILKERKWTHIL